MYGIFTYTWLIFMVFIGKYISPMDPMGMIQKVFQVCFLKSISPHPEDGIDRKSPATAI